MQTYTPDGFWDLHYNEQLDWEQVRSDYDYVYAYGVPQFENGLRGIGDAIYTSGKLELFKLRKFSRDRMCIFLLQLRQLNGYFF